MECSECDKKVWAMGRCRKHYSAEYRRKNIDRLREYDAEKYRTHRESRLEYAAEYRRTHKFEMAEYERTHKAQKAEYTRTKRQNDPNFRVADNLRRRLNRAIKSDKKVGSAIRDLGCSISAFRLYIENQFESGMTWSNYGKWHLDHVLPLSSFDLTDRQDFLTACTWLNYQPLWAKDNRQKQNKIGWSRLSQGTESPLSGGAGVI